MSKGIAVARLFAYSSFDYTTINLSLLARAQTEVNFYNDIYESFQGRTYEDVLSIGYYSNGYYLQAIFGATGLTPNSSGSQVTGGTVRGIGGTIWNGSAYELWWFADDLAVRATSIQSAVNTASTSDDFAVLSAALSGGDLVDLSTYNDRVRGYAGNDTISGNSGDDTLLGDEGADQIIGGAGSDRLTGGLGADRFVFDVMGGAGNVDSVTDFSKGIDKLVLDDDIFTKLGVGTSNGKSISASNYRVGTAAADGNDYLIYNTATDRLYYDIDGTGPAGAVQIAVVSLTGSAAPTYSDFLLIP